MCSKEFSFGKPKITRTSRRIIVNICTVRNTCCLVVVRQLPSISSLYRKKNKHYYYVFFQEENAALRLELRTVPAPGALLAGAGAGLAGAATPPAAYLDARQYVSGGALRPGEDPYRRNRFNQAASDALASDRDVPDTRNPM